MPWRGKDKPPLEVGVLTSSVSSVPTELLDVYFRPNLEHALFDSFDEYNEDGSNGSYLSIPVENRQENGPGEIYKDGEKRP